MNRKQFQRLVRREQDLAIREMRDGCLDCRAVRGLCHQHYKEALEIILHPHEKLQLKPREVT